MSRAGLTALTIANLFVAFQVLRHEWGFYEVMLIYWAEALLLGVYNVLRMLVVGVAGAAPLGTWAARWVDLGSELNLRPRHRSLRPSAPGAAHTGRQRNGADLSPGAARRRTRVPRRDGSARPEPGISFVRNFVIGREYHRLNLLELAFWPYARMSLVGGILLLGLAAARLLPGLGSHAPFAAVMVPLKLGVDAVSHVVEHHWLAVDRASA